MAVSPVFVINGHLLGTNDFEALFWMGCASVVIRIIQTGNQKLWLWFGVLAGMGMSLREALRNSMNIFLNELYRLEDSQEGLRALLEKRKPQWKNR
jgi:hypothetical protein